MQKTLLQDDPWLLFWGLETSPWSPRAWNGTQSLQNGQVRLAQGEATEIGPQGWEEHVFFALEETLTFFLVLCICQMELEPQRGMDEHVYGHTTVLQATESEAKMVIKQNF